MKLRKLFALLMTAVMLLGMVPASHAELTDCYHDWDSGQWLSGAPANCQVSKPKTYTCTICQASMLFKNIETPALERIFAQYCTLPQQIFIAIDEVSKFSEPVQKLLQGALVAQLTKTETLYIKDWKTQ